MFRSLFNSAQTGNGFVVKRLRAGRKSDGRAKWQWRGAGD
jgi:hypothetical protein